MSDSNNKETGKDIDLGNISHDDVRSFESQIPAHEKPSFADSTVKLDVNKTQKMSSKKVMERAFPDVGGRVKVSVKSGTKEIRHGWNRYSPHTEVAMPAASMEDTAMDHDGETTDLTREVAEVNGQRAVKKGRVAVAVFVVLSLLVIGAAVIFILRN